MQINNKIVSNAISRKFIKPLNDGCKYNIEKLKTEQKVKHKETLNLLIQVDSTLKNVKYLFDNYYLVDANVLLRSSLENLMMAMLIQFEENVYKEFIDLSIDEKTRKSTRIIKMIEKFRTKLNFISEELFIDFNREEKLKIITDIYDKLCSFTHSSLIVSTMVEIKSFKEKEILKMLMLQCYYFLKVLLFCSLKYFTNDKIHFLESTNIAFVQFFFLISINNKIESSKINFNKYNEFLYYNDNFGYFYKNNDESKKIQEEIKELENDIKNNPEKFGEELVKFLK